jgi:3-deoxy-manno-octulosonate cytidylyltransferase (CMP-KDO synthetase)
MVVGIIPARYGSTRFLGKLLADLHGKPVLQWTWERARQARRIDRLFIAAGDERIAKAARNFGADVVEVFDDCASGSDRIRLAAERMRNAECGMRNDGFDIVVNIQGDEPLVRPETIDAIVARLQEDPEAGVATPVSVIRSIEDYHSTSCVKVVVDRSGYALYFSRSPIPHGWLPGEGKLFRHIGLYAYRREVLERFAGWEMCELEQTEKLEQLRLLYNGVKIAAVEVEGGTMEVNTEEDLWRVREQFR